jgi:NAD-dependent dihydropyrimidine dehydrogenase PreA subunit
MVIPRWLESGLRLLGYMYLAGAVLFAATGSAFIICRYDPFVAFFRMSGSLNMLIIGASLLGLGVFIARPYCRFLCPYGMILRQLSRISRRRVTITPDECIRCRLCEDMCPFGAILKPAAEWTADYYVRSRRLLGALLVALPLLMFVGGLAGSAVKGVTSRVHATVRLAERVYLEDAGKAKGTTDASTAFRATGKKPEQLYQEAAAIVKRFGAGGRLAGGFMGLVVGLKLIGLTVNRQRKDYEADRAGCLACGRCFAYCPREQLRLKKQKEVIVKT